MEDKYNDCNFDLEKAADEEMFLKEVIQDDNDLLLIDYWTTRPAQRKFSISFRTAVKNSHCAT